MKKGKKRQKTLKQHLTDIGVVRDNWTIHQQRCECDPMYRLLFFSNQRLEMEDGTRPRYIDYLISSALEVLQERYGNHFTKAFWLKNALPHLTNVENTDVVPKLFALLCMFQRDAQLSEAIYQLYDCDNPFDLFANGGNNHFYAYMKHMKHYIEQHYNNANNKYTIKADLTTFALTACKEYIMGPTTSVPMASK